MKKIIIVGIILCLFLSLAVTISADTTWHSESFGGELTVTEPGGSDITWHSESFGGKLTVTDSGTDNPPSLNNENPGNGSSGINLNPELSVDCSNDDGTNFDLYIRTSASGSWVTLESFLNVGNNTGAFFDADTSNMNQYSTTYYWSVNVTDNHGGSGNWTSETYHFTTGTEPSSNVTWHSESFGGKLTVTEPYEPGITWHSESFGGELTVLEYGWGNWSDYWKIGHTSYSDTNMDMQVNYQDTGAVALEYGNSGDPGWIPEDVNDDGTVNYQDTGAVALDYGENYE
ncbi:MAG: hypothetical protein ACTSPB_17595 [Candidatus Thorarchaeota archaeon]